MDRKEMENKVTELVKSILVDVEVKSNDFNISEYLDSVGQVSLIVEIEEAFGITISDNDFGIENFSSINNIVGLVKSYLEP